MTAPKTLRAGLALRLGLLLLAAAAAPLARAQGSPPDPGDAAVRRPVRGEPRYRDGEVLVRFKPGASRLAMEAAHGNLRAQVLRSFTSAPNLQLVRLPERMTVRDAVRAYRSHPDVLYAQPNYIYRTQLTPNDPQFSQLWGLHNTGQEGGTADADIDAPEAWDITTGSNTVVVFVIDTGVDFNHPDLSANMAQLESNCTDGIDNNMNGFVDDCRGIDTINNDTNPFDDHGHGTHVSGTIGARGNNSLGVVGVNWIVQLAACKFLGGDGFGFTSGAIACLDYVAALKDAGVNVIATNNSWGGGPFEQALFDAIDAQRQRGILFIAAAGNAASDNDVTDNFPSNYYLPNVIAVAASTRNENLAGFSNFGRRRVHLAAPGQLILSTTPGNTYSVFNGTSMATPHVAGVAALLKAQDSSRDWIALKNLILAGGDATAATSDTTISGKRLNAHRAMTCADSVVLSRLLPISDSVAGEVGEPVDLAALHIRCAMPNGNVDLSVEPGGGALTLTDDGVLPDQGGGDGIYSGRFIPPAGGIHTLSFPSGDEVKVLVANDQPYYLEPLESGTQGFAGENLAGSLTWQLTANRGSDSGHSPSTSFYFGDPNTFTYNTGFIEAATLTSPPITLGPGPHLLGFSYYLETEAFCNEIDGCFDVATAEVSSDGVNFVTLLDNRGALGAGGLTQNSGVWQKAVVDISAFAGQTIVVRFRFDTVDEILNNFEGWYVDDVVVDGTNLGLRAHDSPAQPEGASGTTPFDFLVTLSAPSMDTVTVNFATADGTATAPADYTAASGLLTFMPGETSKMVTVMVNGDTSKEPDETFFLELSGAGNAVVAVARAAGVILRDEPNLLPVANAGADQTVQATSDAGAAVQLNGSASFDDEGEPLTFRWTGPFGTTQGQNPTVTVPIGIHVVELVVNDGFDDSAPDQVVVSVSSFTLAVDPPTRTVAAGQSATYAITATPLFGPFNSAVTLSCASPLPRGVTCSFSPTNMLTPGNTSASTTLTVTTTATRVASLGSPAGSPLYALWLGMLGLGAVGLVRFRGRRSSRFLAVLLLGAVLALAGCGGGSSSTAPTVIPGTPSGSHAITINANSGSLQAILNVELVVQ